MLQGQQHPNQIFLKMPSALNIPGLNSYRGRYLYLTTAALVLFISFAFTNWEEITLAKQLTSENINNRRENADTLSKILNRFQMIRAQLYRFSLIPDNTQKREINDSVVQLLELAKDVDINVFDDVDAEILNNFIVQIPTQLHNTTNDLITIRSDLELWIPATKIMTQQLSPINQNVLSLVESMLSDEDLLKVPADPFRIHVLEFKTLWLSTMSEFYLTAATHLGLFDQNQSGLEGRRKNLRIRIENLRTKLTQLEGELSSSELGFIRDFYLPKLKQEIEKWINLQTEAEQLLMQEFWRQDILILQKIETLLNRYNDTIRLMQLELMNQSSSDIIRLNQINQSLSLYIILISSAGLILAILGYFFFDRNILRPIARTTRALNLQSQGFAQALEISSKASETKDLVEAFNQMSSEIRQREKRLDFMAHHDVLTGLPNRLLFNERLEHAIQLTDRNDKMVCLMLLDLDRFKLINDTLGHLFGDKLLQETATRLKQCMRSEDTIARLGGDEFAIIVENIEDMSEVDHFASKIINLFVEPFYIDNEEVHVSTSIGIVLAPVHSKDETTLTRFADIAMYQSKNLGRNQYCWFSHDLENAEESIIKFENELRDAITGEQFELHYQPIIDINDKQVISLEALIRWNHPQRGMLYPNKFISILDNPELLFDLTCWVIRQSQQFLYQIEIQLNRVPQISINLHPVVFQQRQYRERIEQLLLNEIEYPQNFVLEVTEDTLVTDMKNSSISLENLHQTGFKIALDDFGTGQSSLSHLRVFPIDIIKIDREFIRDVISDIDDANLVKAIISLSHDLGKSVIAEGVENREQLEFLSDAGCHLIQGHLFSEPMTSQDYLHYVQSRHFAEPK